MRRRGSPVAAAAVLSFALAGLIVLSTSNADPGSTAGSHAERAAPAELLPDLDQEAPSELVVTEATRAGRRMFRLGFASAVINVGVGPLIIHGQRARGAAAMRADQRVRRADGSTQTVADVAALRYVRSPDHEHWHLVPFERYELRRPGANVAAVRDTKTGFCLGDRYDTKRVLAGKPREKVFRGRCGLRSPHLLAVREGISVGYGDDYDPTLEGQYVELTGLPAGRYLLVHTVNRDRRLRESDYSNNTASLLLQLSWQDRRPVIETLSVCAASAQCGGPR